MCSQLQEATPAQDLAVGTSAQQPASLSARPSVCRMFLVLTGLQAQRSCLTHGQMEEA